MTLNELINEYKKMTHICNNVDYANKKSVKSNNKAVDKMYEIVSIIKTQFGQSGIYEFAKLIDHEEDRTNLWASVQLLEKMEVDNFTERKALSIIKIEAERSIGMEYWLKNYETKKKNEL